MAVKSIIDVDVNDEAFKKFQALFVKYKSQLDATPEVWAKQAKAALLMSRAISEANKEQKDRQEAEKKRLRDIEDANRRINFQTLRTVQGWKNLASYTKDVSLNIASVTRSVLKWTAIGSITSGLLGIGGLFGLDRLAGTVGAGRRSSLGLGIGYGAQRSFGVNYGRIVDPEGFLSGVNEALNDASKRHTLYAAGLTEGDLRGKDTGQVSLALLAKLKDLADKTPKALLGQRSYAYGQFMSLQDFERLRATSKGELAGYAANFSRDRGSLDLAQDSQRRWQDFSVQLTRAGQKIENIFVKGLDPLIAPLGRLSDAFSKTLETFLKNPKLGEWMDGLGHGLEGLATYVGSDKFQNDVKNFVEDIGALAHAVASALRWLGIIPRHQANPNRDHDKDVESLRRESPMLRFLIPPTGQAGIGRYPNSPLLRSSPPPGATNPGNLRIPGSKTGFQTFSTPEDGVRAIAHQLLLYQNRDHIDTLRGIIAKYSPPNENDTHYLIRQAAKRTGYGADQALDFKDRSQLAAVVSAITRQEGVRGYGKEVVITILNNTGGNAVVSASQMAH